MPDFAWNPITWLVIFIILLLISKYSLEQTSSRFWITLFLIISYVQGIIFALTFDIPIKFFDYFENMFVPIPVSIMFGIFYFLLFFSIVNIFKVYSNKSNEKFEDFADNEARDYIANIWNMPTEQIKINIYDDGDCPNVQREIYEGKLVIYVGKNFLKLVKKSELLFALSHEVAHFKGHDYRFVFCFFCFLYIVFTCIISQLIVSMVALNAFSFMIITFILFIVGLMTINYLRWHEEYSADYNGGAKIKDIQNFESFFRINELVQNDHGLLTDLIFFDHPSSERRLKNIQKLKDKN